MIILFQADSLAAAISSLLSGYFVKHGRRKMLIAANVIVIISSLVLMTKSYIVLIVGRILRGVAIGMINVSAPLFINEIARTKTKAQEIALFQFFMVLGMLYAYIMALFMPKGDFKRPYDEYCNHVKDKYIPWRIIFMQPTVIALIQLSLFF